MTRTSGDASNGCGSAIANDNAPATRRRAFARDGTILFIAVSAANFANYVYHVVMTHLLGPQQYGALGALLALVLVLSVPTGAVQAVVARRAAVAADDARQLSALLAGSLRLSLVAGIAMTVVLAAMSPFGEHFFHISSVVPVLLVAAFLLPATIGPVGRGFLQGTMRFRLLGASFVVSVVVKLTLGIVFVKVGLGIAGAIGAIVLGEIVAILIVFAPLIRRFARSAERFDAHGTLAETGRTVSAFLAYWLLVSIDLMLVRHYYPTAVSGRYAAATLLGRAVLFLPGAVAMAVYPKFSNAPGTDESRRLLASSLGIVLALGLTAALGIFTFPGLVRRLFGADYVGHGAVGPILAVAMIGYGAVGLLIYYRLALKRPPVRLLWVAFAVQVAVILAVHRSPMAIALSVLVVGVTLAIWITVRAFRPVRVVNLAGLEIVDEPAAQITLSVVTPSFNGASHIAESIVRLRDVFTEAKISHEVILVSDGSTDGTPDVARLNGHASLRVIHYPHNRGKGFALRTGLSHARGTYVAFIDSDGDLDPGELCRFIKLMQIYDAQMVIGSKRHALSDVSYPWQRRVMSWSYHRLVRLVFGLKVSDTQTGIKLVRRDVLAVVLPRLVEKRFAFDLELLVAARRLGFRRILEAPVTLNYKFTSTISAGAVRGIVLDTAAIWYRRYLLRWYDRSLEPGEVRMAYATPVLEATDTHP